MPESVSRWYQTDTKPSIPYCDDTMNFLQKATLMRRPIVLSLRLLLAFPGKSKDFNVLKKLLVLHAKITFYYKLHYISCNCRALFYQSLFIKIARISITMIPDIHKTIDTISWWYHEDTGIIMATILDVFAMSNYNNQYQASPKIFIILNYDPYSPLG